MNLNKDKLNKIIKESIRKVLNERKKSVKLNLAKIFDLNSLPDEELIRQHYDISRMHPAVGFGNPLMKNEKGDYILENDSRVTPAVEVKRSLDNKYAIAGWQLKIFDRGHDIQICVCIANIKQSITNIINDFKQLGYFLSHSEEFSDKLGQQWKQMQFEPIYQQNESTEILN